MSGSLSLRWVGVLGQSEYIVPRDFGIIIAILGLDFGFAFFSIWLDFWMIQRFLTINRPISSMPSSRLNSCWLYSRSGFDQTTQEVDFAHRCRVGDSIKSSKFSSICSFEDIKMTIICWLKPVGSMCWKKAQVNIAEKVLLYEVILYYDS